MIKQRTSYSLNNIIRHFGIKISSQKSVMAFKEHVPIRSKTAIDDTVL
jgi:hypothetical protein